MLPLRTEVDELKALLELRDKLRCAGLDKPTPFLALTLLLFHLILMLGGIAGFFHTTTVNFFAARVTPV